MSRIVYDVDNDRLCPISMTMSMTMSMIMSMSTHLLDPVVGLVLVSVTDLRLSLRLRLINSALWFSHIPGNLELSILTDVLTIIVYSRDTCTKFHNKYLLFFNFLLNHASSLFCLTVVFSA